MAEPERLTVPVKSAWASKINWAQAISFFVMAGTVFGLDFPPETEKSILGGIVAVQSVVTIVLRTWFTRTVTAPSV